MSKRRKRGARGLGPVRRAAAAEKAPTSDRFGEGLALGPWALRALTTGLALIAVGAMFGGVCGLVLGVENGGIAALCIVAVGGIFWSLVRVGGAGIGLGMIGGIAAMLGATELRHFVTTRHEVKVLSSLADWDPSSSATVLRFAKVTAEERFASAHSRTYRGSKSGSTTILYRALPWSEAGRVVGYRCIVSSHKGESATEGTYGIAVESWDGAVEPECGKSIATSETFARRAGVEVAPGSAMRVVRVYGSEAELRADHDAAKAFWGPSIFLGVYLLGATLFRFVQRRKAAPSPAA